VLAAAAVFEGASWWIAYRQFRKVHPRASVLSVIHEGKDPSIFTVLIEDSLALIGLAVAFVAIFLGHRLDNPYIDGVGSIVIGALLASAAFLLAVETRGLLLGEGVSPDMARDIDDIVRADPAVAEPGPALTMYLGPEEVLLNLEVAFEPRLTAGEIRTAVDRIEERLRERYPEITRVFIEVGSLHAPAGRGDETPGPRPSKV
jgi:divalent metal cation (Fe/Co/Zn/Cd) transporter